MATLIKTESGEVALILRGAGEDVVLQTLRHWPEWRRAEIEPDPQNPRQSIAVRLYVDQAHEAVLRSILLRSFGMRFPDEGGDCEIDQELISRTRRRGNRRGD